MRPSIFLLFDTLPESNVDPFARGLDLCVEADRLGMESVRVAEHHFGNHGGLPDPAVFLGAAATCTRQVKLGPAVSVLPVRHPALVAEGYLLVDRLSHGRLAMGVGSGVGGDELAGFGIDPSERTPRFEAHLRQFRELWESSTASTLNVRPHASAPPLYLATQRSEAAHEAGKEGLRLLTLASPTLACLDDIADRLAAHRRGLAESSMADEAGPHNALVMFAGVADSEEQARHDVSPHLEGFRETYGIPCDDAPTLYDAFRRRGTGLFGSTDEITATLDRLRSMGVDELVLWCCFADMPKTTAMRTMRSIAAACTNGSG